MSIRLLILSTILCFNCLNLCAQKTAVETSGDILQIALPATAALSTFIYKDGTKPTWQFAKSMIVSFGATHILKRTINRQRPNGGDYSFPSGHTSAAFTGAAFIHKRYGIEYGIPAYALASYAGWTRVNSNKHYWTDIAGGAIVGFVSAFLFTKTYENPNLSINPVIGDDQVLLNISVRF